jgi:hypothetical protein
MKLTDFRTIFRKSTLFFILVMWCGAYGFTEELSIGRNHGWESLGLMNRTALRSVQQSSWIKLHNNTINLDKAGNLVLSLAEAAYQPDAFTDLLLHFDRPGTVDGGNYHFTKDEASYLPGKQKFGSGAALFRGTGDALQLMPERGSLFWPGSLWRDFTIEFWLRPHYLEQGESILLWEGTRQIESRIDAQKFQVELSGRRLVWRFENIFLPPGDPSHSLVLKGNRSLIPETWHHHSLTFQASTGLLVYRIDGADEAIIHATESGREGGTVFRPFIGGPEAEVLQIGSKYTGYIDELRISTKTVDEPELKPYRLQSGIAETVPLDLGSNNASIVSIKTVSETRGMSDILYSYRQSNRKEGYQALDGEWIPFTPGEPFSRDIKGRYLQFRFELFPDGTGTISPLLSELNILYEKDTPPVPPSLITVKPAESSISVEWSPVSAHDLSGYLLFYGTAPDDYRGDEAEEGRSPIDVGADTSINLTGLENGKLYFFRIASYDNNDPQSPGPLSREFYGRPKGTP